MKLILLTLSLISTMEISITQESGEIYIEQGQEYPSFGSSVIFNKDELIIGAIRASTDAATYMGAVYTYQLVNHQWVQSSKIWSNDGLRGDFFGYNLSKDGNRMVIGAPAKDGVFDSSGAIYVFEYIDNNWVQTSKLIVDDPQEDDWFGVSVNLKNDRILAASFRAIYEFKYINGEWVQTQKLTPDESHTSGIFSFTASESLIFVGDMLNSDNGTSSGALYIFELQDDEWIEIDKLYPSISQNGINFGYSSDMSGNRVAIGAFRSHINGPESGSVYIYEKNNGTWMETDIIHPNLPEDFMHFGLSISLKENKLLVGAPGHSSENATSQAYEFNYINSEWIQTAKYRNSDYDFQQRFGKKVSHFGKDIIVTASQAFDEDEDAWKAFLFKSDFIFANSFN